MKTQRAVSLAAIVLLVTLGAFWLRAQNQSARNAATEKPLVLRGGILIDGNGGAPINNAVLVMSGGKIQSVGTQGSVDVPADATVIDTTGKTIMPGLFDSHVHLRDFQLSSYLYWGVTSVGEFSNQEGWVIAMRDAVERGREVGPHIYVVGGKFIPPIIPGHGLATGDTVSFATWPFDGPAMAHYLQGNSAVHYVWDQASAEREIAIAKKDGVDGIKEYNRTDPKTMKIIAQVAHANGLPVFAHYTTASNRNGIFTGTDEVLDTGIDVHVHMYGLIKSTGPKDVVDRIARGDNVPNLPWSQLDTSKFPSLIQKMVAVKMFLNPTVGALFEKTSKYREGIERLNDAYVSSPVVANLPESTRARLAESFKPGRGPADPEGYKRVGLFVKNFVDAGGKIIAGDDSGGGRVATPGLALQEELQMLNEIGLTPMQVIQAATKWGMEAWRKDKEAGTLEPGKRADVLVLNRNPLDDITATSDIYRVIVSGTVIDRDGLSKWQETVPKPMLVEDQIPNPMLHVPFVDQMWPELVSPTRKMGSELTITGENFSNDSLVLLNNRLIPGKVTRGAVTVDGPGGKDIKQDQLRVPIPSDLMKKPGLYTVAVVQPGANGGVSNTSYLIVEAP